MKSKMITKVFALLVAICGLQVFGAISVGDTVTWSNTNTTGAISTDAAKIGESHMNFYIPPTADLPEGSVVRIKKITFASPHSTFTGWEANNSDAYAIKLNGVQSGWVNGAATTTAATLSDDKKIASNATTSDYALEYTFSENCDITVGKAYPGGTSGSDGTSSGQGIAFLWSNSAIDYGNKTDYATCRYVCTGTASVITPRCGPTTATVKYYPVYAIEASVISLGTAPNLSKWDYSPAVFTLSNIKKPGENSTDLAYGFLATEGKSYYGTSTYTDIPGQNGTARITWCAFCSTSGFGYVAPGYTLRFVNCDISGAIDATFKDMSLGGLCVASDSTITGITSTGTDRNLNLGDSRTSGGVETYYEINKDFTLTRGGGIALKGALRFNVGSGVTFNLNGESTTTAITTLDPTTSGNLIMTGDGTLKVKTLTATGAVTLDFSNLAKDRATEYIDGAVTIDSSTTIKLPKGVAPGTAYKLCKGTLTAGTTCKVVVDGVTYANAPVSVSEGTFTYSDTSAAITIANGSSLTLTGGDTEDAKKTYTGVITVQSGGKLTTTGYLKLSANNVMSGTLDVTSGVLEYGAANNGKTIGGTTYIRSNATLKLLGENYYDTLDYNGSTLTHIYGTLDMGSTRWTLHNNNTINLYPDGEITGSGQIDTDGTTNIGSLDSDGTAVTINAVKDGEKGGTATISAPIRPRNSKGFTFNVKEGMTLVLSGTNADKYYGFTKTGDGTLKITGSYTLTGNVSVSDGGIELAGGTIGTGTLTVDEGTTLTISKAPTSGSYDFSNATISGNVVVNAGEVTLPSNVTASQITVGSGAVVTAGDTKYTSIDFSSMDLRKFISTTTLMVSATEGQTITEPTEKYGRTLTPNYDETELTKIVSVTVKGPGARTLTAPTDSATLTWGYNTAMTDTAGNTAYFFNGDTVQFNATTTVSLESDYKPIPAAIEVTGGSLKMTTKLYPVKVDGGEYICNDGNSGNGIKNVTGTDCTSGGDPVYVRQNTGDTTIYFDVPSGAFMQLNQWADQTISGISGRGTLVKTGNTSTLTVNNKANDGSAYAVESTTILAKKGSVKFNNGNGDPRIKDVSLTIDSSYADSSCYPFDTYGKLYGEGTLTIEYAGTTAVNLFYNSNVNGKIAAITDKTLALVKNGAGEVVLKKHALEINGTTKINAGTITLAQSGDGNANAFTGAVTGDGTLKIPENVQATVANTSTVNIAGAGTVIVDWASKSEITSSSWTGAPLKGMTESSQWQGTYWFKNATWKDFNFGLLGNASSKVKLTGIKGYAPADNTSTCAAELVLEDVTNATGVVTTLALELNDGYSTFDNYTKNTRYTIDHLSGSGTVKDTKNACTPDYFIKSVEGFEGEIYTQKMRFTIGTDTSTRADVGKILIQKGATATVASGKTWTSTVNGIAVNGTMNLNGSLSGTVRGEGTIVTTIAANNAVIAAPSGLATSGTSTTGWTGTVIISASNQPLNWGSYGNSGSTIVFNGVSGWAYTSGGYDTFTGTVKMQDKDANTPALNITSGSSDHVLKFTTVTGDGTVKATGTDSTKQSYGLLGNISGFTGTISTTANYGWMTGTTTGTLSDILGKIIISADTEATIADGKTWGASSGIVVNGTLTLETGSTMPYVAGGSGTIVAKGKIPNNSGLAQSTWTGTLEVTQTLTQDSATQVGNAGSALSITAGTTTLSAATSLPGTVSITAGAALKVPSTCAAPTSLVTTGAAIVATTADSVTTYTAYASIADALAAVGDSGSLKLFSDVTNAGELTIGEGATLDLNGKSVSGLKLLGSGTIVDTAEAKGTITFANGTAFTGTIPADVTLYVTAGTVNLVGATILGNNTINNNGGIIHLDRKAVVTIVDGANAADASVHVDLTEDEYYLQGFTTGINYNGAKAAFYLPTWTNDPVDAVSVTEKGYLYFPAPATQTVTWAKTEESWYDPEAWKIGVQDTEVTWFDGCQTPVTIPDGSSITLTKAVATTNVTLEGSATLIGANYIDESVIKAEAKIVNNEETSTVTYYKTLASAIGAAADGAEVILMKSVTLDAVIPSFSKSLTINLNGKILQGAISGYDLLTTTGSALTIKNGTLYNKSGPTLSVNGTTLTLDKMNIVASGSVIDVGDNGATIYVDTNGATLSIGSYGIKATGSVTINGEGALLMGPGVETATVAIQSVSATAPTITINNTNTTVMSVYALYAKSTASGVYPAITIKGGKYWGSISQVGSDGAAYVSNKGIKGGIFSETADNLNAYTPTGYGAVDNTDESTKTLYPRIVLSSDVVATLGLSQYTSFTDAVNAAVAAGVAVSTITVRRTDATALATMPAGYTLKDGKIAEDTTTWTGNGGDDDKWTTAANWDNGVPTTNSRAVISLAEGKTMTFDCATTPFSVTFSGEGTVKVTALPTDKFKTALESTDWTGMLEYVVSTDTTLATTDTITCNGTFKKSGTGTLILSAVNQIAGTTKVWVSEGVLKNYGTSSPSPGTTAFSDGTAVVTLENNAVIDLNGAPLKRSVVVESTGGSITNSAEVTIDSSRETLKNITLNGPLTVGVTTNASGYVYGNWFGMADGYTLALNNNTLTKVGNGTFYIEGASTVTGAGTIDVTEGSLYFQHGNITMANGTVQVEDGAKLIVYCDNQGQAGRGVATVSNVVFKAGSALGADRANGYGGLKVTGTLTTEEAFPFSKTAANGAANLELGAGATLKLGDTLTINSTFTPNSSGYVIDASNMLTANSADTVRLIVTNGVGTLSTTGVSLIDPTGLYVLGTSSTGLCATKTKEKFPIGSGENAPSINIPKTWLAEKFPDKTTEQIQAALIEKPSGAGMTRAQAYALGFDDVETAKIVITSEQIEDPTKFRISVMGSPTVREGTGLAVEYKVISSPSPSRVAEGATTNSMGTATSIDMKLPTNKVMYYFIDADLTTPSGGTLSSVRSSSASIVGSTTYGASSVAGNVEVLSLTAGSTDFTEGQTLEVVLGGTAFSEGQEFQLTAGESSATAKLDANRRLMFTLPAIAAGTTMTVAAVKPQCNGTIAVTSYAVDGVITTCSNFTASRVVQMLAESPYADGIDPANWKCAQNSTWNQYRIPGIAKATNGVAVAVYDCRYMGNQDLGVKMASGDTGTKADGPTVTTTEAHYAPIDIAGNESTDGGLTWSEPKIVIDVPNCVNQTNGEVVVKYGSPTRAYDIGDPCIVYDPGKNRFWLMGITGGGNTGFASSRGQSNDIALYYRDATAGSEWKEYTGGEEGDGNGRYMKKKVLALLAAKDDSIKSIASDYDSTSLKSILQGPGHGIVTTVGKGDTMPKGTIVFPMQFCGDTTKSGPVRDFALYSTDGGDSWQVTKLLPSGDGDSTSEPCIAELDDGSWCMMVRTDPGNRTFFRTSDFSSWTKSSEYGASFTGVGTQGSLLKIGTKTGDDNVKRGVYASSYPTAGGTWHTTDCRSQLKVFFGTDNTHDNDVSTGKAITWTTDKWTTLFVDGTGEKGYSSMIMVDDNTLGILYEAQNHIYFDTIDISGYVD